MTAEFFYYYYYVERDDVFSKEEDFIGVHTRNTVRGIALLY